MTRAPAEHPPAYVSCASLARELDVSETTVHEMVRRGVLPQPIKLSPGCVRWCWADVEMALGSLSGSEAPGANDDPFLTGGAQCHVSGIGQPLICRRACIVWSPADGNISTIRRAGEPIILDRA